jgi:selenide,water dikinase
MTDSASSGQPKLTAHVKAAGCAAKISAGELGEILRELPSLKSPALLTGMDHFEDAAVYRISEDVAIIQTTDFFPPVVDDPYTFGRIAAVNALSDVYAMGGRPVLALNILCFPTCDYPLEIVRAILKGGADAIAESGAVLAGGHSIQAPEPIYGLSVTGLVHPSAILTNGGAKAGDALVLSKSIGTGVGLLGMKGEQLSATAQQSLLKNLTTLNDQILAAGLQYELHAATDITGFGLIGHLHEMAEASGLLASINAAGVPLLPAVRQLAAEGFVPAGAYANRQTYQPFVNYIDAVDDSLMDLLFDPQTAGGLLFSLPAKDATLLTRDLKALGVAAATIGAFRTGKSGQVEVSLYDKA